MKRLFRYSIFPVCLLLLLTTGCAFKLEPLYVDLGAATATLPQPPANVQRIFLDRMGSIYPDVLLPRAAVRRAGSRIDKLFADSAKLREQLLAQYELNNGSNETAIWRNLQHAIAAKIVRQINTAAAGYNTITLIIHGIGNDINQDDIRLNRNPFVAYQKAEQRINNQLGEQGRKTFFVEIYWDGLHRVKPLDFIGVFSGARTNSLYAGLGLRNIVQHLKTDSLVILTHSLGANVACELLFNQRNKLNRSNREVRQYFDSLYNDEQYHATPQQKSVRLGMLVPAIPGTSTFKNFYQRTGSTAPPVTAKDRYKVWVGYNNKDRIITKHIIAQIESPLIIRYFGGSTALGGLRGESKRLAKLFRKRFLQSSFTAIDFQNGGGDLSPQTTHYFSNYCDNQHFPELIKALYE